MDATRSEQKGFKNRSLKTYFEYFEDLASKYCTEQNRIRKENK